MGAEVIDGKRIAEQVRAELRPRIASLQTRAKRPGLAAVLVGDKPASALYVKMKARACEEMGLQSVIVKLPRDTAQERFLAEVQRLNTDSSIHGILVQQPLPSQIPAIAAVSCVSPLKDVDCFHPENVGLLLIGIPRFAPATPAGVVELLLRSGRDPSGKHVVILGRSNIVGKPLAALLMQKAKGANATVTVCHSATRDLRTIARSADILVAAMGRPELVTKDMVKPGAVVIDVGINRVLDATKKQGYRTVGDVRFDEVREVASAITPVPGGVGPMTIAMLLSNTVYAAELAAGSRN
jgi:methylenetetrahydrofolate dehydrogenase (NADP+)/methenyltetrahydrofolate cyclohydrolase